ncbi:MAG: MlaC/ttg2D family ABC transporter substrate-binding protein [bacterium]
MRRLTHRAACLALLAVLLPPAAAAAGETDGPQATIERTTERIIAVLEDPALQGEAHEAERRAKIIDIVNGRFQWPEMARRSLGRHWRGLSEAQRQQFIPLFSELIRRTYLARVEGYEGEEVRYVRERVDGRYARVHIAIVTTKRKTIPVVYSLKRFDGRWLVYDFQIEGVRIVNNYRRQFDNILARGSFEELIDKLEAKLKKMREDD